MSDTRTRRNSSEFTRTASTPGFDDSPHIHFAINQLTRDGDNASLGRQSSLASDDCPAEHVAWDEGLGYFIRSPEFSRAAPEQRQQPPERPVQDSVDPESFIPVEPPDESLLYPPLDFVPVVLRPLALTAAILCSLLMVAGIVFCNVWSQHNEGLWDYDGLGGSRYFVFQFLPQILAAIIIIWTFVIQAAVYRTMPFVIMASERPLDRVLQKLPTLPRNFVLPDLSHFRYGEPVIGFSLFVIWLSNFITIPLLSCLFQAKYYVTDERGIWRWTSVQAVGWTLVAIYGLLAIGFLILLIRFARAWSGLMWDPVCLADLISIIQRSNILHDFEHSEILHDAGEPLEPKVLRLGYWKISNRHDTFYGIGEVNAPVRTPSLHQTRKQREKQPQGLSDVSFDLERQNVHGKDMLDQQLYSPSVRYRWITWFLRKTAVVTWIASAFGLLIAFLLVSFINDAIRNGFPPRLPTLPTAGGFSSSNFLYSFIPSLIGTFLCLFWQPIDVYFRAVQPFATLSDPNGATPEKSLLVSYQSNLPFKVSALALLNGHYKVAWISLMSIVSIAIPILAGGVFIALWHPSHEEIRIASLMPAFYAIIVFCALYAVSSLCIWPGRARHLPHNISTLADLSSFLYKSPLLSDKLLREPRSKTDLVTRLVIAPPGEREYPVYGFGVYVGRDGREHLGIDRFHRPGRADMLITTGW
ncbi:hypothetical protein PHISP_06939 [Aspergillus sp. HF37]|nr:hypothetical protein PHISP_06939 [Aspergillus sp. HF37]